MTECVSPVPYLNTVAETLYKLSREFFSKSTEVSPASDVAFICSKCGTKFPMGSFESYIRTLQTGDDDKLISPMQNHDVICTGDLEFFIKNKEDAWLKAMY